MHECLTIHDDDEGDHRCPLSCFFSMVVPERGISVNGHENFLFNSQIISIISGNRDYCGLITG
jgi:hypothetical protein